MKETLTKASESESYGTEYAWNNTERERVWQISGFDNNKKSLMSWRNGI